MFELLYVANIKVPLSVFRGFLVTLGREDHLGQMESQYVTRLLTHTHTPDVYCNIFTVLVAKSSVGPAVCLRVWVLFEVVLDKHCYCISFRVMPPAAVDHFPWHIFSKKEKEKGKKLY